MFSIEQVRWGMKMIAGRLRGKIVEIASMPHVGALFMNNAPTCGIKDICQANSTETSDNTNARHLELYSVLAEHPLSYCPLSTATPIETRKRTKALIAWTSHLRDKYEINPDFCLRGKDMGEIGMAPGVWKMAKLQLCWWHMRKALRERFAKRKLSTTPYNGERAHGQFGFIIHISSRPVRQTQKSTRVGSKIVRALMSHLRRLVQTRLA